MSEDAGIEPRAEATLALTVRRFNHSARSHPKNCLHHGTGTKTDHFNPRTVVYI
jgi:hypothetical protein